MLNNAILRLEDYRRPIELLMKGWYTALVNLPPHIRQDEKKRTGIQILIRQPGKDLLFFSVGKPSDRAMVLSVEKAIRSELRGEYSSQNSADEDLWRYPGSLTVALKNILVQASGSGMRGEEDAALSAIALAAIFKVTPWDICQAVKHSGGQLPDQFFNGHYLSRIIGTEHSANIMYAPEMFRLMF